MWTPGPKRSRMVAVLRPFFVPRYTVERELPCPWISMTSPPPQRATISAQARRMASWYSM